MTTPKVVSPRGTEDGKIFLYTSDSATKAELQSGLDIAGLQGVEVEFTNDEDELIGDEEKKDIYSRNIGVMLTVAHACINLETLAALLNTTFFGVRGPAPTKSSKPRSGLPTRHGLCWPV